LTDELFGLILPEVFRFRVAVWCYWVATAIISGFQLPIRWVLVCFSATQRLCNIHADRYLRAASFLVCQYWI